MLLSLPHLISKYSLKITGVVHCGARWGEEAEVYRAAGIKNVTWIEGNPGVIRQLRQHVQPMGHRVIQALLFDQDDIYLAFHVSNHDGESSSIFEFGTHPSFSPETVFVRELQLLTARLDTLVAENGITGANLLNMDLQGAELHCLKGAPKLLESIDYVYSEVNTAEVYKGCAKIHELDEFLVGFERVETGWSVGRTGNEGWGDGLWLRSAS